MATATKRRFGEDNNNWRGGRTITQSGYVLLRMPGHHLADCRGYVYEHRLVAEQKLGRRLLPGELVHHIDENKQNNVPSNLEIVSGNAEHFLHHRKTDRGRRKPGESNPQILCECGCGEAMAKFDDGGRPRKFINGHNSNGVTRLVLTYLECVPGQSTARFIAEMFEMNEGSVRNALARLRKDGKAVQVNGEWRLVA